MKKNIAILLFPALVLFAHIEVISQETLKTVTQKVEKTFEFNNKYGQLLIEAERGNVHIERWDRKEISIVLSISAKNTNLELAKQELGYMRYNLVKSRGNVFINNKMVLPATGEQTNISSVITARYEIHVPKYIDIRMNNKFGRVTIRNVSGFIGGNLLYCDMLVQSYNGVFNMNISVGDLNCMESDFTGDSDIKTKHANVIFTEVGGKVAARMEYGSFNHTIGNKSMSISLYGYATDILINNKTCHTFDLRINGQNCPLSISKDCYTPEKKFLQSTYQPGSDQPAWLLQYVPDAKSPKLKIDARFGTINLL